MESKRLVADRKNESKRQATGQIQGNYWLTCEGASEKLGFVASKSLGGHTDRTPLRLTAR